MAVIPRGSRGALPGLVACSVMLLSACTGAHVTGRGSATRGPEQSAGQPVSSPGSGLVVSPTLRTSPAPSPPAPSPLVGGFVPAADRRIPKAPGVLARDLTRTDRALHGAIDGWVEGGPSPPRPPQPVALLAMYEQRIFRLLGRDDRLARRTLAILPPDVAGPAAANVAAAAALFSLITPVDRGYVLRVQRPQPPGVLLGYFREAERRFGVDWELLAAVMLVESKFGRTRSASTAGAQGPMQFIPTTWAAYGLGGDIQDPHDAILGAANYLHATGAPGDDRRALFAYNHAAPYVDAVEAYANEMRRDPDTYFAYYNWQVFLLTTSGDRRLTGPGE